jgi:hypothetical protein
MLRLQILASALPGVRDLRAPVITGYMWLLFAWLIVQPDLGHKPHGPVAGSLYDLGSEVGHIWVAIAVGVAAYLVGSVSQVLSEVLQEFGENLSARGLRVRRGDEIFPIFERGRKLIESSGLRGELRSEILGQLQVQSDEANYESVRELNLPAILLVGDQAELFAEVDRLRAEGELRIAVTPALCALGVLLTVECSPWWLLSIPTTALLLFQGMRRIVDSKSAIAEAIRIGRIPSASSARFADWVDNALPALIEKAGSNP